jgi:hypothetical protein
MTDMERWAMRPGVRRRILAVGSAALLAFTVTSSPLSAADLGMPTKAPIYKAPEAVPQEFDLLPLALLLALGLLAGLCAGGVICETGGGPTPPPTTGGNTVTDGHPA